MKQLIFNFNMFDVGQQAVVIDLETGLAVSSYAIDKLDDAGAVIAKACMDTHITKVHLYGEQMYLNDFVIPEIKKYLNLSHYNTDIIEIEVN